MVRVIIKYLIVAAILNYAFDALCRYFDHLCHTGYMKRSETDKLLLLTSIQRLVDCDFRGYLNEEDYIKINEALYNLYGTTCLLPYPDYYSNKYNRIMYTCSISELAHRVKRLESMPQGGGEIPEELLDKEIIIPGDSYEEVDDIID